MARVKIGKDIKRLRERAGMTQRAFADTLGVSWRSVQTWEADRVSVDSRKAESLLADAGKLARKPKRKENTK